MGVPGSPDADPGWLPSGFPPRSFPPGAEVPPPPPPMAKRSRGRGRWLAAAAALLAVLLLAGALLATRDEGGDPELSTGPGTTVVDTSNPTFDSSSTVLAPLPSIDPVSTTTAGTSTTAESAAAGPGVLQPSLGLVTLPKADGDAGAVRGPLDLRNTGGSEVTYTTSSSTPGLSASPARGAIGPGGSATVTVTLDGARVSAEGPFTGTLSFEGGGATKEVKVQSTVGRAPVILDNVGEACPRPSTTCSRQIALAPTSTPDPTPCNTPWLYSVTITDQSRIQSARAVARLGLANADSPLRRGGSTDIYQSDPMVPVPAGTALRFALEAVDELGFGRRLPEQTIAC